MAALTDLAKWFIKRLEYRGFGELRDQLAAEFPEEKDDGGKHDHFVDGAGHGTLTSFHGCGSGSSGAHLVLHEDEYYTAWNDADGDPHHSVLGAVLDNDQDCNSEHVLSVAGHTPPQNGVMTMNSDGGFEYTPNNGYIGPEMMFYYASDGYASASVPLSIYVYWPDIDVDSNNDGDIDDDNTAAGTDDPMEGDPGLPGKVLALNDDDDDGNGTPDYLDNGPLASADDDLVEMELEMMFANHEYFTDIESWMRVSSSYSELRIWDSPTKNNQIVEAAFPLDPDNLNPFDNAWLMGTEQLPASLWIEGLVASLPPALTLFLQPAIRDEAFVAVVDVNLHADSDNDGDVDGVQAEDDIEMDAPGSVLSHNVDDDNGNGVQDWQDAPFVDAQGQPMNDPDLEEVELEINPLGNNLPGFTVELVPDANIRLWSTQDKQPLDLAYNLGTDPLPTNIFVEGIDLGQAQLAMTIRNPQGAEVDRDTMLFTVMRIDAVAYRPQTEGPLYGSPFAKTPVPFQQEENPGVGIRQNGDDDNNNNVPDNNVNETPVAGENDLIEVDLVNLPNPAPGIEYVITRSNENIQVWEDRSKTLPRLVGPGDDTDVFNNPPAAADVWVEWIGGQPAQTATLTYQARAINTGNVVREDTIIF